MVQVSFQVKKKSGEAQVYAKEKVIKSIFRAQENIDRQDRDQAQAIGEVVDRELKARFERDKILSSREIGDVVERVLIDEKLYDVARAFIIAREKQRQEAKAERGLGVIDDIGLPYTSILVMKKKYLRKDNRGQLETPKKMLVRVARAIARAEKNKRDQGMWSQRFFQVMKELRFLPAGRTLANAGTVNNQLASCFVLPMPDSVEGIFDSVKESSILKKNGGGVGFAFSHIRPKGDEVATTSGKAAGPVAFMKVLNDASDILKQAGGRKSGNMVVLHITHPDILEFITCKEEDSQLNNINFSLGVTDKFMEAAKKDKPWDLINPHSGQVVNTVSARSIFELAASFAWKNGDPGMVFLDRINRDNPTPKVGVLEAVNLCGEQPLLAYEACNLGSINLGVHLDKGVDKKGRTRMDVDWDKLKESVEIGVRFLDNVVSVCHYPLRKVTRLVKANRKIGLGVMGWADMLVRMRLAYNSPKALKLAEKVMKFIRQTAWQASAKLGRTRGSFPNFKGSIWEKRGFKAMRNATTTTIAPTGSISMMANCSYGIEPHFALAFYKEALSGINLPEINDDLLEALRGAGVDLSDGLLDAIAGQGTLEGIEVPGEIKRVFVTAHDLDFSDHVKMQAAFQKYTDNAVSKTINLRSDVRIEDVAEALMMAWESGCKGITVYRDKSRSEQVLNVGYNKTKKQDGKGKKKISAWKRTTDSKNKCPQCGSKMFQAEGCATCPSCAFSVCSL